jgi:hypothetical protein
MNLLKNLKKGQALPLNTIVIAILVIVVLLVIIVFFTSQVGETGEALEGQSVTQCNLINPTLATLGYSDAVPKQAGDNCEDILSGSKDAGIVPNCCVLK